MQHLLVPVMSSGKLLLHQGYITENRFSVYVTAQKGDHTVPEVCKDYLATSVVLTKLLTIILLLNFRSFISLTSLISLQGKTYSREINTPDIISALPVSLMRGLSRKNVSRGMRNQR